MTRKGTKYEIEASSTRVPYDKGDYVWSGPEPEAREGYIFVGWSLEENASEPLKGDIYAYTDSEGYDQYCMLIAEENVTLYALWAEKVTVTYEAGEHGYFTELQYDEEGNGYEAEVSSPPGSL